MSFPLRVRGFSRRGFRVDQDSRISYGQEATVDLDDQWQMRILRNERNNFFSIPELSFSLKRAGGAATATTASGLVFVSPRALVLKYVRVTAGTAPTGTDLIVDVKKVLAGGNTTDAGTTVFTTQSRRPTITAGQTISTLDATNGVPQVSSLATGDILRAEIAQVGGTIAGSDLIITFKFDLM